MGLVWMVLGTWLFWRFVGKPVHDWFNGFKGVRIVSRYPPPPPPKKRERTRGGRDQILEADDYASNPEIWDRLPQRRDDDS